MSSQYDVVVVGGGPGGYVAAIRCAQLGFNTACVDAQINREGSASLGGTCLNVGCIPSKALLDSSEQFHKAQHDFSLHGINMDGLSMDVSTMQTRKDGIVASLTGGIQQLFKANNVTSIFGRGHLLKDRFVEVYNASTGELEQTVSGTHVILATGSIPVELGNIPFDHSSIVDSTGALEFQQVPPRIGIVGAGVIGLELGSVWNRLGSDVVLLEAMDDFLATADKNVSRESARQFKKQGLDIRLGALVEQATVTDSGVTLTYRQKDESHSIDVDKVIVAVGRRPATEQLLADDAGVSLDERGRVSVDDHCRTAVENVWAIGDCVRGPMLAHKSSEEGIAVAERIAGNAGHVDFNLVPWVIYTDPEIAWVGQTEAELSDAGIPFETGSFPFAATGRAKAMESTAGFVKMIAHAETDRLLGVHMVGPHVSELIGEAVMGMAFSASAEDFALTVHAHPTLSEATHEAALSVAKRAIHKVN
ncbi:MAG: dihydrolipoyl dehydrogenase [Pseudomonadota bacterium]